MTLRMPMPTPRRIINMPSGLGTDLLYSYHQRLLFRFMFLPISYPVLCLKIGDIYHGGEAAAKKSAPAQSC